MKIRHTAQQSLQKLIGGEKVVKAPQGDGVGHPRIVGIEGDDIGNPHAAQLLQSDGAVQRFPAGTLVLPSFIEKGHDHVIRWALPMVAAMSRFRF